MYYNMKVLRPGILDEAFEFTNTRGEITITKWEDARDKPTISELLAVEPQAAILRSNAIVAEDRMKAYGRLGVQLDMLYWDKINNTTNWEQHIAGVKNKYPKVT